MTNGKTYHQRTDEQLMESVVRGCEPSFAELYDRYGVRMHRYFYRMLGQDAHRADDFTQDLFLKLVEKRAFYDPQRRFSTWFYAVAGNMVKNEYRRVSRIPELPEQDDFFTENHSQSFDNALFEEKLNLALNDLDETQRQCFVLRYQEERSVKEIAEILECPEGTVKSRLFYTAKKLANRLRAFAGALV